MTDRRPKAVRRKLRVLSSLAYQRELSAELEKLHKSFDKWKAGEIDVWELNDSIHRHHQGPSQQLFTVYSRLEPESAVTRALALSILDPSELPESERKSLETKAEMLKSIWDDG